MSDSENFDPSGYQEDDAPSQHANTETTVVKPKSKLPLIIFGSVFVVLALGAAYVMFAPTKKVPVKAPTEQVAIVDNEAVATDPLTADVSAEVDPFADTSAPADVAIDPLTGLPLNSDQASSAIDPLTGLPVQQMTTQQIDPLTGLPVQQVSTQQVDPATGLPIQQMTTQQIDPATGMPYGAQIQQQVQQQIDPATGMPIQQVTIQQINPATGMPYGAQVQQQINPATGLPMQQAPVQQNAQINPATGLPFDAPMQQPPAIVAQIDPTTGLPYGMQPQPQPQDMGMSDQGQVVSYESTNDGSIAVTNSPSDDILAQFRDVLAPIDGRVTKLEKEVSSVKRDISAVAKRVGKLEGNGSSSSYRDVTKKSSSSSASRDRARDNSIRVDPPVSRIIIQEGSSYSAVRSQPDIVIRQESAVEARVANVSSSDQSCSVQAIVQGRAWLKQSDGAFVTYGVGDNWTNGGRIEAIDPEKGINVDGKWSCL